MVSLPQFGLRGVQLLWTVLITALIGNVIAEAFAGNPSSINYAIFVAVFSWVVLLVWLLGMFVEIFAIPMVSIALDGIAALLTLIAGIVLAAKLHVHSCSNRSYILSNSLTNGSHNPKKRCHELQASTAFFWFLFLTYAASLALTALSSRSGGMTSSRGGIRKGGPSMSHV